MADAEPGGVDREVRAELLARFGDWHEPIAAIISATPSERVLRTDISDRDPIEDAIALDRCLFLEQTMEAALRRYEACRVPRANSMVVASRRLGAVAQWKNPAGVWLRNMGMRLAPPSVTLAQARKLMRTVDFDGD